MDKQIITFSANEQNLVRIGGEYHYSSNKVSYIGAHFDLGANWDGFDSVRAVWFTDRINGISTVLDGEGNCTVPTEVLKKKDRVFVNLVGSIVSNGELTDRLTTYPAVALVVDSKAKVDSTETAPVTPSQFEQFVSIVQDAVANIKDIVSTTLNADYTLTFVYSDGTSYTTPSIRGERGPQGADGADGTDGNGIASAVLNSNYTLTLTFTDGTSYTTPSIRGAQGPKGDPGDVSQAQLDAAISDLKSDTSHLADEYNRYNDFGFKYKYKLGVLISTGAEQESTTRIITPYVKTPKGTKISVASGYKYRIYAYSTPSVGGYDATKGMSGSYHTEDYEIDATLAEYYLRYMVAKSDDSTIDDVDAVASKLSIVSPATDFDLVEFAESLDSVKQDKVVQLGVNLIDAEHPTSYNESVWSYANGVWTYTNNDSYNLRFDIDITQAGKYTISYDFSLTSGQGRATIRNSSGTTLDAKSILTSADKHQNFTFDFETAGTYRFMFSGTSGTACGSVTNIMVAKGVQEEYVPYSETVDNAVKAIYFVDPRIDAIEQKISSETKIADYNLTALKAYEKAVKAIDADIKIPLMTDCHTDNIETYEMLYHMANSGASDFCVNLGDYIPTHYDTLADCISLFEKVARNYNTIPTRVDVDFLKGNHDNNVVGNSDSSAFVSNADFYNQLEWREKSVVGKTNKAYGYRDIEHAKIRVIMLDASDIYDTDGTRLSTNGEVQILQPQFEWFVDEALDFSDKDTPTNWQVIILAHASLQTLCSDAFKAVLNAFQSGSSVNGSYTANSAGYSHTLTADKDFTSQGAIRVICTVSGHQHADMIKQLGTTTPISEVYVACENQGAYYLNGNNEQVWYTRTAGTILKHCIETICVQRDSGKVVFKRLGIGSDREISY